MDPNEALKNARALAAAILKDGETWDSATRAEELANAFEALDEWLSKGGFLPEAWKR